MGTALQTGAAQGCAHRPAWRGTSSDPARKGAAPHPQPGELPRGQHGEDSSQWLPPIALALALRAFHPQHKGCSLPCQIILSKSQGLRQKVLLDI